jgi:2-polyprenyl-3-methyl-5-hydroxy-6-metoxy-1,4-benzoquinol methylase
MDEHEVVNRRRWDELVPIHARSAFYDVDAFRAGHCTLRPLEVEELGEVGGKSLLHLQCHFGLDTLSWARRGARVSGVDFAPAAVEQARALAAETGLAAEFLCARVQDLPAVHSGRYDIVFTSYGVLCWLADLRAWAHTIAHFLRPGGVFYMAEVHPFADVFDDRPESVGLHLAYPYFPPGEPLMEETQGSYADRTAVVENTRCYFWIHTLGEVLTVLLEQGLRLEFVHEFPYCVYPKFPGMTRGADGWYRLPPPRDALPLLFSVRARKPGDE